MPMSSDRAGLEADWLRLTREVMPSLAAERDWPVRNDHCFQRILLDNASGGVWYAHIAGRPAYRHADAQTLESAVALGQACVAGDENLDALNRQSLKWRGVRGSSADRP